MSDFSNGDLVWLSSVQEADGLEIVHRARIVRKTKEGYVARIEESGVVITKILRENLTERHWYEGEINHEKKPKK